MNGTSDREIYFSFFMFTADLRPEDARYTRVLIEHMLKLVEMRYDGFDLHIAPPPAGGDQPLEEDVESYRRLKRALDKAGLERLKFATNVGTTSFYDPTSPYVEQRRGALKYLKSRVDITEVLGGRGSIMSGPFLYPYGAFPLSVQGEPIWSDALQDWMQQRYSDSRCIMEELAGYAAEKGVTLALEPVKNWETPPPNMVSEALGFVESLAGAPCGITIDTAQVLMESQGPEVFRRNVRQAASLGRLNYVHISPPDRGAVRDSWIPWDVMLGEIEPLYDGPYLIEIFNAIPPFDSGMRMTRRRFWRPGEDEEGPQSLNAYRIAEEAIGELRRQIARVRSRTTPRESGSAPLREPAPGRVASVMGGSPMTTPHQGGPPRGGARAEIKAPHHYAGPSPPARAKLSAPIVIATTYGTLYNAVRIHTFISSYADDNIANATHIIEGANELVIVDGQFLAPYARQFRAYADGLNKPIARVFLSHRHPDHWFGMPTAFSDTPVYALKATIDWVKQYGKQSLADHVPKMGDLAPTTSEFTKRRLTPGAETIDGVKYVFEEVDEAEVEAQLIIKLPELGVAIVQDLIYSGTHLYLTKQMEHWGEVLQGLLLTDYKTFLPGHGRPADRNEVAANMEYLSAARRAFESGLSQDEFQKFLVARYPARLCPGIFSIYLPRLFGGASEY